VAKLAVYFSVYAASAGASDVETARGSHRVSPSPLLTVKITTAASVLCNLTLEPGVSAFRRDGPRHWPLFSKRVRGNLLSRWSKVLNGAKE
jgi:hypothetical protein